MFIGALVRGTILMKRAQSCDHVWKRLNPKEEQCEKCTIIVTEEGKRCLLAQKAGKQSLGTPAGLESA